jgi:hypothetical protein
LLLWLLLPWLVMNKDHIPPVARKQIMELIQDVRILHEIIKNSIVLTNHLLILKTLFHTTNAPAMPYCQSHFCDQS